MNIFFRFRRSSGAFGPPGEGPVGGRPEEGRAAADGISVLAEGPARSSSSIFIQELNNVKVESDYIPNKFIGGYP